MIRTMVLVEIAILMTSPQAGAWTPNGAPDQMLPAACLPQTLENTYLDTSDPLERRELVENFIKDCQDGWSAARPQGRQADAQFAELTAGQAHWKEITLGVGKGRKATGYLALQPGSDRRPTVLVECDWNCDPRTDPGVTSLYLHLYEEAGFHVLALRSPYVADEAVRTREVVAGGLGRGADLLQIGLWLRVEAPFRQRISSLHVVGIGWGGHSTLYSLLYNDYNPIADDRKVFNSALALCPAVDLKTSVDDFSAPQAPQSGSWLNQLWQTIIALRDTLPGLGEFFTVDERPADFIPLWVASSHRQLLNRPPEEWALPFRTQLPQSSDEFLNDSNFAAQSAGVATPSWVLATHDDENFQWSRQGEPLQRLHRDPRKSKLSVYGLHQGAHCALDVTHGWANTGSLLRTLLLGQSYEIWPHRARQRLPWTLPSPKLPLASVHAFQGWTAHAGESNVDLTFSIWHSDRQGCQINKVRSNNDFCVSTVTQKVPLAALPSVFTAPASAEEAERLTRQLNVRLRLLSSSGQPLSQSQELAGLLEFVSF